MTPFFLKNNFETGLAVGTAFGLSALALLATGEFARRVVGIIYLHEDKQQVWFSIYYFYLLSQWALEYL